ncbi:PDZ domain-containing protein [Aquibacillus koreensis]|uniref:endopeptidase La n=1 Tax=Aquibacillus koreensis TaxID=279446 RepID=A0A9X3WKP4_9BACI|nr:SepM family pheromone-processing serine protease [Aquibacillus koreensis]MCT2538075.1 PDZ domain-containing protein [Aquibacillus koreensis]MDC3420598.1 PDZ domain-containing protein [Aquibacillus koreensis]
MRYNRRNLILSIIVILFLAFLVGYQLPFYIYKPGGADALNPVVQVDGGHESAGDMHLVTVRGGQATPLQYLWASFMPHQDIHPLSEIFPEGITQEEYFQAQLQMMESSQEASIVVAYEAANKQIEIEYEGVYVVAVIEGMPAEGILQSGDKILSVDHLSIQQTDELIDYVGEKKAGTTISITIEREGDQITEDITLEAFPELENKVGMGVQLVTDRTVTENPNVEFKSGNIGGPSAGLMFSLEIYDQLTERDITNGLQIAGTGEVDYEGNVGRIGGIDKKVIAADEEGCDVFFAPNENGSENSNFRVATETAKEIGSEMTIVPVDTFEDALEYLEGIEGK